MAAWFVYVVRCRDGTLYTGIARDVVARIAKHNEGKGARYTRGRGPVRLLHKERKGAPLPEPVVSPGLAKGEVSVTFQGRGTPEELARFFHSLSKKR